MEAWENLVPLSRIVYNILTQQEKTFSLSFLKILFSKINLKEYPNLITTLNSFTRGMRLFLKNFYFFIYYYLAVLSLHCFEQAFSGCSEQDLDFVAVLEFLNTVASLLEDHRLSSCGTWA